MRSALARSPVGPLARTLRARWQLLEWERSGASTPGPQLFKQRLVREYGRRFGVDVLVETGTYLGDMVDAQLGHFKAIYTIELSNVLAQRARARFAGRPGVTVLQGDSGLVLREVLPQLPGPALFWLDGHYSEGITAKGDLETPIREELRVLLAADRERDVILIDDARCFSGQNDYPTVDEIVSLISRARPDWRVDVDRDVIRAHRRD